MRALSSVFASTMAAVALLGAGSAITHPISAPDGSAAHVLAITAGKGP